jgi:hypothetical protein
MSLQSEKKLIGISQKIILGVHFIPVVHVNVQNHFIFDLFICG